MTAIKLFEGKNRDDCHRELEKILDEGKHPHATCTEDNGAEQYCVWSEPPFKPAVISEAPAPASPVIAGRIEACEKEVQEVLERHGCVMEIRTLLVNGIVAETAIVAVLKK